MKTIPNHPNYKITEDGQVWSNKRMRFLTPTVHPTEGYKRVSMAKTKMNIHRLMALTYLPNPENKRCVDHINRNRTDNRLSNLRWATHKENNTNTSFSHHRTPIGHGSVKWLKQTNQQKRWMVRWSMNGKCRTKTYLHHDDAERHRRLVYFLRQYIIKR